jgi:hypothetical protein
MSIPRSFPSSYVVKIHGNPGAGKTFILCTTCNTTRNVFGKMDYDMATVTTDVAADLICGETHIRSYLTPTQKKSPDFLQPTLATSPRRRRRPLCDVLLGGSMLYLMRIP